MKQPNLVFIIGSTLLFASNIALATPINTTWVKDSGNTFAGMAVDSTTGETYQLNDYFGAARLVRYANAAAFEADTPNGTIDTQTRLWGTYLAAQGGSVFARTSSTLDRNGFPADAQSSKISGSTGVVQTTTTVAGMEGRNGAHTFDWGGFSGVNAMSDGNNLYVVGGTSTDWRVTTFDYNLNATNSIVFSPSNHPGYAFAINGYIFFGDDFYTGQISTRVNASTGAVDTVDFSLLIAGSPYVNNVSYDAHNDTLYIHSNGSFYKVSDAANAFGVASVPLPASLWLFGSSLLGILATRRKSPAQRAL